MVDLWLTCGGLVVKVNHRSEGIVTCTGYDTKFQYCMEKNIILKMKKLSILSYCLRFEIQINLT